MASVDRQVSAANVSTDRLKTTNARRKSSMPATASERAMREKIAIIEAEELTHEERRLAEMGYKQVYKREFSWLSCISFAVSISGLYASVATTYVYPLYAGGAASAVWCWLISGAGCMCIALSVAELVSAYPTSGGLYFTCKYLAPLAWMPEISWLCGWMTVIGQIAGLASTEYGCSQLLLAAVSMSTNFSYIPTNDHTVGVMAAIILFHAILNSFNTRILERMTRAYVVFHLAVLISCCVVLLVMCDNKHSSEYVWTTVEPQTGWTPPGFSFLFGFLSVSWTMTDYDATAHIAEEIKNPEIKAPWSITIALAFTYIGGWLFTIVLSYCAGDIATVLADSPIEQPVAQIFYNVMGQTGGVIFTVFAFVILNFTGMTGMQAGARAFWAVSRDEMIPLSRVWVKINSRTQTPLYSVWLLTIICILINLIGLGSYVAIEAIFSVTAIGLDWSYCIPIICKMIAGRFEPGPFYMGKASFFVNCCAVTWTLFVSIIFVLPGYRPVTADNMNYASVILVAIFLFSAIYWFISGRNHYRGPRVQVELIESTSARLSQEENSRDAEAVEKKLG